jgi:hypothetical protein
LASLTYLQSNTEGIDVPEKGMDGGEDEEAVYEMMA